MATLTPNATEIKAVAAAITPAQLAQAITPAHIAAIGDYVISKLAPVVPPVVIPPIIAPAPLWAADFTISPLSGGAFTLQARDPSRAVIVPTRNGRMGPQLTTLPGDNSIFGSGEMERCDLMLSQDLTDGYEGHEAWWAWSILFPDSFQAPLWHRYVVFDFHNTTPGPGQAPFMVNFRKRGDTDPGILQFEGYGGDVNSAGYYAADIGTEAVPVQKNVYYDFLGHVRWSSGADGFFDAWVNGVRKLSHQGPTLYAGQGVYLKASNYHTPVCDPYPACIGTHSASSVIHDRIMRGATRESVELR